MGIDIRLQWKGREDAEAVASAVPKGRTVRIAGIGEQGANSALEGSPADVLTLAARTVGAKKFGFAYVCAETAVGRKCGTEIFSDLLKTLLRLKGVLAGNAPVVFRPHPDYAEETLVLFKEVYSEMLFQRGSVLRGYEGFSETALACPDSVPIDRLNRGMWRHWSEMSLTCCPKGGTALFVGLDEASSGFIDCMRTRGRDGSRAAFAFSLETALQGSTRSIRRSVDAWNALRAAAETQSESFRGLDIYEAKFGTEI